MRTTAPVHDRAILGEDAHFPGAGATTTSPTERPPAARFESEE